MTEVILQPQKTQKPERNYGIELLRIISMLFIVVLHVIGQGGIVGSTAQLSVQYMTSQTMLAFCYCAVNLYALISGYVGCKSKFKLKRLSVLWLSVVAINAVIWIFAYYYNSDFTAIMSIRDVFKPLTNNQYWYFTAYVGLQIILPALNSAVNNIPKKQYLLMLVMMFLAFSFLPVNAENDLFYTHSGYSMLWLVFMYLAGGYFRLHFVGVKFSLMKTACLAVYILSATSMAVMRFIAEKRLIDAGSGYPFYAKHYSYTSVFVVICSLSLFVLFMNINVKNKALTSIIGFFSKSTFGVYIIHTNLIVWVFFLGGRFASYAVLSPTHLAFKVVCTAIAIFLACTALEKVRELIFSGFGFVINACVKAVKNTKK